MSDLGAHWSSRRINAVAAFVRTIARLGSSGTWGPAMALPTALANRCLSGLVALLALLAPVAARADLTATYRRPNAHARFTIEIANDGSIRFNDSADGYKLWTGGEGYAVVAGPGGPLVFRFANIEAARINEKPPYAIHQPWVMVGKASISGRVGTKYKIRGAETNPAASALVISQDPALTILGTALLRYDTMESANFPADKGPERISRRAVLEAGAPIDYYDQELTSLSAAPIPAERFRLPAPPKSEVETQDYWASPPSAPPPTEADRRRDRDRSISRAVFAEGRLWMLSDSGGLSTVLPGSRSRQPENAPAAIADICAGANTLMILTKDAGTLQLWRRQADGWRSLTSLKIGQKERVLGISCSAVRSLVLTDSHVALIEGAVQRSIALSEPIKGPIVATSPLDGGGALYVGLNAGEWGGGLARIDLMSGLVTKPSSTGTGLCSGPLNADCDPVNGVARKPGDPKCFVVAIGLVHLFSHGRLTEVCGDQIRRYFYKPYTFETTWAPDPPVEPSSTVPFFGLAEAGGRLWAVGGDGLYEVGAGGVPNFRKMPAFYEADGVAVSFEVPGLVLVRTSINAHVSLSGAVPLLVSR